MISICIKIRLSNIASVKKTLNDFRLIVSVKVLIKSILGT